MQRDKNSNNPEARKVFKTIRRTCQITDPTRANFPSLITMDQLLEIGQERSHPKPGGDQENALIFAHRGTDSVRSTEQHRARAECHTPFTGLSVI